MSDASFFSHSTNGKKNENDDKRCHICFGENCLIENPIIQPCDCKGDTGFIHVKCLRKWIEKDLTVSEVTEFQTNYVYTKLSCDICKGVYPDIYKWKNEIFALYNFERPSDCEYFVF